MRYLLHDLGDKEDKEIASINPLLDDNFGSNLRMKFK